MTSGYPRSTDLGTPVYDLGYLGLATSGTSVYDLGYPSTGGTRVPGSHARYPMPGYTVPATLAGTSAYSAYLPACPNEPSLHGAPPVAGPPARPSYISR